MLFYKPVKFIKRADILSVTAGRGGCAQTRYIDLHVEVNAAATDTTSKNTTKKTAATC
jgi:hypothetical protein